MKTKLQIPNNNYQIQEKQIINFKIISSHNKNKNNNFIKMMSLKFNRNFKKEFKIKW